MRALFKKPWFVGVLMIGVFLIVFFLNLWIMTMNLAWPYDDNNFWVLASNLSANNYITIYAFVFMLLFYISIAPILLSGFSIIRKSNWGFTAAIAYFIAYETVYIVFQVLFRYLTNAALTMVIINMVLVVLTFVLLIFRTRALNLTREVEHTEKEIKLSETKIPLVVLLIDIVSVIVLLTTFFMPLYSLIEGSEIYYAMPINVLLFGDTRLETIIYFLANFALFLGFLLYFANCLSNYFFDKERFINKSKSLISFAFITTLLFFLTGLVMTMVYTLQGSESQTFGFIPLILMCVVIFIYAIFRGKFNAINQVQYKDFELQFPRIEPLLYVFLLTAITALMLVLNVIKIEITSVGYSDSINLTGLDILRDYASLDPGYRLVAFILVVMLISSGIALVISIAGYLAKYSRFNSVVRFASIINVFFVFILAVSGYYFQIGQEIDRMVIADIFAYYGISLPNFLDYEYAIKTDAIYALIGAVTVVIIMFLRKAFDREEITIIDSNTLPIQDVADQESSSGSSSGTSSDEISDDNFGQFDPCPAFTQLDARVPEFQEDLKQRKAYQTKDATLNKLIHFVVEYARNSRLHLSYTPEDIATFVAGLGASKLSILQGMSGTGKTSLPKIFSEAIFGNCEIIEVESSWKDKNELLGYYNEFSMKYTPKKFTLALYKAALNQEIFTFILLDEMNLSRIEYYFSDFLSLMENEEGHRELKLINIQLSRKEDGQDIDYVALDRGNTLKVPANVWFIGTANRDESTFVISDKVYDRAQTMNFTKRAPKVRNYTEPMQKQYFDYETMNQLFNEAKANGHFDAEQSDLIKQVELLVAPYNISFGNRILKQIEDFVNIYTACFPNEDVESAAIEKILLSKVVAKLEVKTIDDKEKLEMDFEKLHLHQCVAFIKSLDNE